MVLVFLTIIFFSFDFFLKKFIQEYFTFNTSYPLIGNIVDIRLVHNRGAAFGILQGKTHFLIIIGVLFLATFLFWAYRQRLSLLRKTFVSMIIGGALCNLYDRIVLGYVIDYIDLGWWPVFNLSDSLISVGCIAFIFSYFFENKAKVTRKDNPVGG